MTPGQRFRYSMEAEKPLQIVGVVNAYTALLAQQSGFRCLYLSGSGVAASSLALPDLGMTSLDDVIHDARRITATTELPLLVDADTGWGGAFNIARTVKELGRTGVAGMHIEDQVAQKRCGHRPNKMVVGTNEMCDRIKAAVDAKDDDQFVVMARTDALSVEGFAAVLDRVADYRAAGADAIFAEAMTDLEMYRQIVDVVDCPVLANLTEFGKTDLYTTSELRNVGIAMALYPLSAFRAMSKAASDVFDEIRQEGTQREVVSSMQTRDQLYDVLGYHEYEQTLDRLFDKESHNG